MSCQACAGVEGAVHTCPGSGTFVAAEAYGADAVTIAEESEWPRWRVTLHFNMRHPDEDSVRSQLVGLVSDLLSDDLVESADFALKQWEAGVEE